MKTPVAEFHKLAIVKMSLLDNIDYYRIPAHIAIIMDGNGRWANRKGLDRIEGHKEGVKAISRVIEAAARVSVKYLTLYAFSTENWNRPAEEVQGLMDLMVYAITEETKELIKKGVKVISIGDANRLPEHAHTALNRCIDETKFGERLTLIIALSYSSRWELTETVKKIVGDTANRILNIDDISEETISSYLCTSGIPNPDLLIRTGGEQRISNFLLWQCAYTEFYFTDLFWPDFEEKDLYEAIINYQRRERRYGKISEQVKLEYKNPRLNKKE